MTMLPRNVLPPPPRDSWDDLKRRDRIDALIGLGSFLFAFGIPLALLLAWWRS